MSVLVAYTRERLVIPRVASAVLLVACGAQLVRSGGPSLFWLDLTRAVLLVAAFRIWDDLADRAHDRDRHPTRVSVGTEAMQPLVASAVVLWTCAAAMTFAVDESAAVALLAFTILLGSWYALRPSPSAFNSAVILTKYSLFVAVLIGSRWTLTQKGALAAASVFAAVSVYEWAHDGGPR
jgi:hypothetical protein